MKTYIGFLRCKDKKFQISNFRFQIDTREKKIIALRPTWVKKPNEEVHEDDYMMAAEPRPLYVNQGLPIERII